MPANWLTTERPSGLGELARQFILAMPFGASNVRGPLPTMKLSDVLAPTIERNARRKNVQAYRTLGLLPDDLDDETAAGMTDSTLNTAIRLLSERGREAAIKDVPGGIEAMFPGTKPPEPSVYGILPPEMGQGPSRDVDPVAQQAYDQIAGLRLPRKDIYKQVAEHQSGKSLAEQFRRQFPEDADLIPESVSTQQATVLRGDLMKRRDQRNKEAKELAVVQSLATQYGLPPELPLQTLTEMLRDKRTSDQNARQDERTNRTLAGIAGKFQQGVQEWDRRFWMNEEAKVRGEDRGKVRSAEDQLVRELEQGIRSTKDRLAQYETLGLMTPEQKARVEEIKAEIKQLQQRQRQVQKQRLKDSPLGKPSEMGAQEHLDLFGK